MAIVMVTSPALAGGGTIFGARAGAGITAGNGMNVGMVVGVWVGAVRVASATAVAWRSGVAVVVGVGGMAVSTTEIIALRFGVAVGSGGCVGVAVGMALWSESRP